MGRWWECAEWSARPGTFSSGQTVTLATATAGASIRYTTDGSAPSSTVGTPYSGAFTISTTATINAIAYKSGMTDSSVTYTIQAADGTLLTNYTYDLLNNLTQVSMPRPTGTQTRTFVWS